MTKEEIFEMARQAGFEGCAELTWENVVCTEELEAFAKLVEEKAIKEALAQTQEPVAWVYPEGLEALKAGKPWTAYGTRQEPDNTALYLSPQPDIAPYAWVTFTPYGDEDDVWYENPEGQLLEGWTYKPLYDTTPPQRKPLTDEQIEEIAEGYLVDYRIPAGCAWNFARDIEAAHGIKETEK